MKARRLTRIGGLGPRWREAGSIVAAVLAVAACTAGPRSVAPSTAPGQGTENGTAREIDRASVILDLRWSPDGSTLAVVAAGSNPTDGRIELLDPDGTKRRSIAAFDAAWVDATNLIVLKAAASGDQLSWDAWLFDSASGAQSRIGTGFASLLGNDHGTVALVKTPLPGDAPPAYALWADGALTDGPLAATPVAWSPDGSLLALETAPAVASSTVTASTGSAEPARLVVLAPMSGERRFDSGSDLVDGRLPFTFSPDGTRLAATGADGGTLEFDLVAGTASRIGGATPFGWTTDGRLVLISDEGAVQLRDADGSATTPQLPVGLPVFGPAGAVAVLNPGDTFGSGTVTVGRDGKWRTVRGLTAGEGTPLTWSPDGVVCYVATGTTNSDQELDRLLLVVVP